MRQRYEKSKQSVIEPEVAAEEKQNQAGHGSIQAAVLAHGVEDPVASAGIPENAAEIPEQEPLHGSSSMQVTAI